MKFKDLIETKKLNHRIKYVLYEKVVGNDFEDKRLKVFKNLDKAKDFMLMSNPPQKGNIYVIRKEEIIIAKDSSDVVFDFT